MYCDVLWHRVPFWFHLMRYFTHQRRISKKYGPLFFQDMAFQNGGKIILKFYSISYVFSRVTQEYSASKRSSLRVIFFEEQGDLWRFCVIPNWSFQWSIWFHLEILRSGTSMLSNFSHFGCNLGILGDTVMIK